MPPKTVLFACALHISVLATAASADNPPKGPELSKEHVAFFETYIRPVLAERCYSCHSTQAKKLKGKLLLDSRAGMAKGGESGPLLDANAPDKSRLSLALRWTDPDLAMPPNKKLSDKEIEKFEQWVKMGAPDPRTEGAAVAAKGIDFEAGRAWWSFQPVAELAVPVVKESSWPKRKIDSFVLRNLEEQKLAPSSPADPRTLIQRGVPGPHRAQALL